MKRSGRFTKVEILEAKRRYTDGQTLYKIGREMRRSQSSIKGHLMNLGLIEYNHVTVYENQNTSKYEVISVNFDFIILSFLLIVTPSLGLIYVGLMFIKD